jgi:hypothetical protein
MNTESGNDRDLKVALVDGNNGNAATPQTQPNHAAPASACSNNDITEYLRAQDRVILDTVRLTQFT